MADVTLTRVSLTEAGPELESHASVVALTTGNTYYYDNKDGLPLVYLFFSGAATVTIETPFTAVGAALGDVTVVGGGAGEKYLLKPRVRKYYNQTDDTVKITTDANNVSALVVVP